MKKLFVCALAASMFTACSQDETISQQSPMQISFDGAFVENATRAADPSTTTGSIEAFDVWAFMDKTTGQVFVDEDVTKGEGGWSYKNIQYWLSNHTYYFGALAPMNSENWSVDIDQANTDGIGEVSFTNVDGTEDLLYAATSVKTGDVYVNAPEKVKFHFSHLLSKVKFSFTNGFSNENAKIIVKNVKMVAPKAAQINLAQNWWSTHVWKNYSGTTILDFGHMNGGNPVGNKDGKKTSDNERLTIPTEANQVYNVTFDVELYFGEVLAMSSTLTTEIKGAALELGKAYNFHAVINETNIDQENGELKPIEFDAPTVEEWGEDNVYEGEITTPAPVSTEEALATAAANGGSIILAEDITLSAPISVAENKVLTINLNGKTLTNKKENSATDVILVANGATLTINGEGTVEAVSGNDGYAIISDGTVIINGGTFKSGVDAENKPNAVIYVRGNGKAYVNGGSFPNDNDSKFVLNKKDADRATTVISVTGGTFGAFNPADNAAENPGTNFVAEGYQSTETEEGSNIWVVTKK